MKKYPIPTGYLFTDSYSKGELETLSIGDYGKSVNVKADFLGLTEEISGVLVFVPSLDEEEGLVTCGNAVLGGSQFRNTDDIIKIQGLECNLTNS